MYSRACTYVHMSVYSFIPRPQMIHGFTMCEKKSEQKIKRLTGFILRLNF